MAAGRVLPKLLQRTSFMHLKSLSHLRHVSSQAQCLPGQWQLVSAVCLQRQPVITAERTKIEQQFSDLMADMELENSLLSDHELQLIRDRVAAEKRNQSDDSEVTTETDALSTVTALDLEDAWESEAKEFMPAPRVTEADAENDQRSLDRLLDKRLVLLVKQTLGEQSHWVFPQGPRQDGDSMRQAAERALGKLCGDSVRAQFLGNAPCGFHQYRFPPAANIGTGAKVFFYKAWYTAGDVKLDNQEATDHLWVTLDELPKFCSKSYLRSVKEFLVDL